MPAVFSGINGNYQVDSRLVDCVFGDETDNCLSTEWDKIHCSAVQEESMEEPQFSRRRLLAGTGVALSAAIAGCSLDAPQVTDDRNDDQSGSTGFPDEFEHPSGANQPTDGSALSEVFDALVDSVAAVRIEDGPLDEVGAGTAWVYDDEYLVTNDHVVFGAEEPFLWFDDGGWREASIVGRDVHSDLAVLEADGKPESATPLPLVDTPPAVGTSVAAIGNPFDLTGSFTTGIISGRNRNIDVIGRTFSIADGIQTDAAVNPGNSGGPLVTYDGEVAGVITATQGETIGFAVSAAMTKRVVPALIEEGSYEHSYLGVLLQDVEPAIIETNDLAGFTWGVYIHNIVEGGPSDGVLQGTTDTEVVRGTETPVGGDVIVEMGDWDIPTRERLSAFLALETRPGDTIPITVIRDGQLTDVELMLGSRDESTL